MKTKICSKCKKEKDFDKEFSPNGKSSRSRCKECEAKRAMEGYRKSREYLHSLKDECTVCGYNKNPRALEYHHPNDDKDFGITKLALTHMSPYKMERLKNEIEKCFIVCANCHRELHSPEFNR